MFELVIETLAVSIRKEPGILGIQISGQETKLTLYADYLILYVRDPWNSLAQISVLIGRFGDLSGYKVNQSKSMIMSIHVSSSLRKEILEKYLATWVDNFSI